MSPTTQSKMTTPIQAIDLKVYRVDDGELHIVVALDEDDAVAIVYEEMLRCGIESKTVEHYCEVYVPRVIQIPKDREVSIADPPSMIRKRAYEWIEQEGRGYLGSTIG